MGVNKVDFGGKTLIDLTGDTLESAEQLLKGIIAHAKDGSVITGLMEAGGGGGGNYAYGKITLAEDVDNFVINHGLNAYPTLAFLFRGGMGAYPFHVSMVCYDESAPYYKWNIHTMYAKSSSSSGRGISFKSARDMPTEHINDGYYVCYPSINLISFNKGDNYQFKSGATYIWLATTEFR